MNDLKELNELKVAKNAYRLIMESKFSIESVAYSLNISERIIYYWGAGKRCPNIKHLYGLSQLFNVSMESILA